MTYQSVWYVLLANPWDQDVKKVTPLCDDVLCSINVILVLLQFCFSGYTKNSFQKDCMTSTCHQGCVKNMDFPRISSSKKSLTHESSRESRPNVNARQFQTVQGTVNKWFSEEGIGKNWRGVMSISFYICRCFQKSSFPLISWTQRMNPTLKTHAVPSESCSSCVGGHNFVIRSHFVLNDENVVYDDEGSMILLICVF